MSFVARLGSACRSSGLEGYARRPTRRPCSLRVLSLSSSTHPSGCPEPRWPIEIKKDLVERRGLCVRGQELHEPDVGCLQTLRALLDGELHLLAFGAIAEAFRLDRGVVDEDIRPTLASEEAIALVPIEPFDRTDDTF